MLARFHTAAARPFYVPGTFQVAIRRLGCAGTARAFHGATGEFTSLGPEGAHVTKKVPIYVGDPGEAYVMISTEIGQALRAGTSVPLERPGRLPLIYFHDTQCFALDSSPGSPRLVIPQQLPRQSTTNASPATLYLYGLMHQIAIDGTADAEFAELASDMRADIGKSLNELKDM